MSGELDASCETLRRCWQEAGAEADQVVRAHWPALRPVLWKALASRTISPPDVLPALRGAFADGEALVAMIDHPDPAVRRAAVLAGLAAEHPAVLARLEALRRDADSQVVAAAFAALERLRTPPPPLRFEVFGGFRVKRAGWELDEPAWGRPMAARVIRFLLLQDAGAVPEDELFDAFWTDRPVESYETSSRHHDAIGAARRLLAIDPHNEHAHRQLMVSYARTGQTSHALRQYLECRRALVVDVGVEPSVHTSRLQAQILEGGSL